MAVHFTNFAISLQNTKIISAKMNGELVMWLNYACDPQNLFSGKSKF